MNFAKAILKSLKNLWTIAENLVSLMTQITSWWLGCLKDVWEKTALTLKYLTSSGIKIDCNLRRTCSNRIWERWSTCQLRLLVRLQQARKIPNRNKRKLIRILLPWTKPMLSSINERMKLMDIRNQSQSQQQWLDKESFQEEPRCNNMGMHSRHL